MIQRIQTIFFLLSLVLIGLMSLWPLAEIDGQIVDIFGQGLNDKTSILPFPLVYLGYAIMALLVATIFLYRDRKKQLLAGRISYIATLAYVVLISLSIERVMSSSVDSENISYGVSLFLPLIALALIFLGNRGVKRDEDLVKSLDRLR